MFGNHEFQVKSSSVSSNNIDQNNITKDSITRTLVGPYAIMMRDKSKESKLNSSIEISKVRTRNESETVATSIHQPKHGPKTLYYNGGSLDRDIGNKI